MDIKLLLFEGIPGSGKSTLASKANEYLSRFMKTNLYIEGKANPIDLAWCACIPLSLVKSVMAQFPKSRDTIEKAAKIEGKYAVVAYNAINDMIDESERDAFRQCMEGFEIYDGRIAESKFSEMHLNRWKLFEKKMNSKEELSICESMFFQNHITEKLLFHNKSDMDILDYLLSLLESVMSLYPTIFYLSQPDIEETIERVADERRDAAGNMVWLEFMVKYVSSSPYGVQHGLKGKEGLFEYMKRRKEIEYMVLDMLPIKTFIINNTNYLWDNTWNDIVAKLDILFADEIKKGGI